MDMVLEPWDLPFTYGIGSSKQSERVWRLLETEEETCMKNHLKWERLKVKGDERSVQKGVKIEDQMFNLYYVDLE